MKGKRFILALSLALVLILSPVTAFALSDITGSNWLSLIIASHNGTLPITNQITEIGSTSGEVDTQKYIDNGYMDADGYNIAMRNTSGADVPFAPGANVSNPWLAFVPSIGAEEYATLLLYWADSINGTLSYFPGSTGMYVVDDPSVEFNGSNFTLEANCFVDTTAIGENITIKDGAFRSFVGASGNITSRYAVGGGTVGWQIPTANNSPAGWTNNANARDGNWANFATVQPAAGTWSSYLELSFSEIPVSLVKYKAWTNRAVYQIDIDAYYDGAWNDVWQGAFVNLATETRSLAATQNVNNIRVRMQNGDGVPSNFSLYDLVVLEAGSAPEVSENGLGTDAYSILTSANGTHMTLTIDGVLRDTTAIGTANWTDTANNWVWFDSDDIPYAGSDNSTLAQITVNGTLAQTTRWELNDTVFSDLSGRGNDAYPSFRTTGTSSDLSANITSFEPISPSTPPSYALSAATPLITTAPVVTGNWTTDITTPTFPGSDVIVDVSTAGNTPSQLPFTLIFGSFVLVISMCITYVMRNYNAQSFLVKFLIMITMMGIFIATGVFDFWMMILFIFIGVGLWAAGNEGRYKPLGSSMIGGLAFIFIGMTVLNRVLEGAFVTADDFGTIQTLAISRPMQIAGFTVPTINLEFFTVGLPRLVQFDYSFFGGNAGLIQYFLYSFTAAVSFMVFVIIIGLVYQYISRLR